MTHQYFNILEVNAESNKVVFWKGDVLLVDGKVATSLDCCCTTTTTTTTTPTTTTTTTPTTTTTTTTTTITITTTTPTTITTTTTITTPTIEPLCCPTNYFYYAEGGVCCPEGFVWSVEADACVNYLTGQTSEGQIPNSPCVDCCFCPNEDLLIGESIPFGVADPSFDPLGYGEYMLGTCGWVITGNGSTIIECADGRTYEVSYADSGNISSVTREPLYDVIITRLT